MVGLVIPRIVRYYPNEVANPENRSVMCPSGLDGEIGRGRAVFRVLRYRLGPGHISCGVVTQNRSTSNHRRKPMVKLECSAYAMKHWDGRISPISCRNCLSLIASIWNQVCSREGKRHVP